MITTSCKHFWEIWKQSTTLCWIQWLLSHLWNYVNHYIYAASNQLYTVFYKQEPKAAVDQSVQEKASGEYSPPTMRRCQYQSWASLGCSPGPPRWGRSRSRTRSIQAMPTPTPGTAGQTTLREWRHKEAEVVDVTIILWSGNGSKLKTNWKGGDKHSQWHNKTTQHLPYLPHRKSWRAPPDRQGKACVPT